MPPLRPHNCRVFQFQIEAGGGPEPKNLLIPRLSKRLMIEFEWFFHIRRSLKNNFEYFDMAVKPPKFIKQFLTGIMAGFNGFQINGKSI